MQKNLSAYKAFAFNSHINKIEGDDTKDSRHKKKRSVVKLTVLCVGHYKYFKRPDDSRKCHRRIEERESGVAVSLSRLSTPKGTRVEYFSCITLL